MVGKPCAEAVANHSDCVLYMYTLLCRRTYERIEGNRVHAQHLSHPPQLVISAGRLDGGAVEGRQQSMIPLQRTYFHVYICMRARVTVCVCVHPCVSLCVFACVYMRWLSGMTVRRRVGVHMHIAYGTLLDRQRLIGTGHTFSVKVYTGVNDYNAL